VFVDGWPFQPSLMFAGKGTNLPRSRASERYFTQIGSVITRRHLTRLKRLATDKQSNLLRTFVNYGHKKFYNIEAWCCWCLADDDVLKPFFLAIDPQAEYAKALVLG